MRTKILISVIVLVFSNCCFAQVPILNSYPTITGKVIYLDFDGQKVSGTGWNNGGTINALPTTVSSANMIMIWKRVSEDYRPFDVNVTTDSVRFNMAPPNKRMRVVFTPTSSWYGTAGGVAFLGSFSWGGTPGTPCWVFENQLGYNARSMAEAAAHEVGHTLSLSHQSVWNNSCVKTAEYHSGNGTGVTSWAPIMGVGYSKNVTIWHNGKNSNGCNTIQFDHSNNKTGTGGITAPGMLSFLPDDVGDVYSSAKILNLSFLNMQDSGLVGTPADKDAFRFTICNNRYVSLNVKPWALDTINYSGADLDVKLKLYNSANVLLAGDSGLTKLSALVGMNLTAGSYYFTIDGDASNYYSDYGSLGRYYIKIKATNPPTLANSINTNSNICSGQNSTLTYTSNGVPTQWQWSVNGPSSASFTTQNPVFTFSPSGVYTINLLATSNTSPSCMETVTLNVGDQPTLTVSGHANILCAGSTATLLSGGALSYTWLPGNFGGNAMIVNPTVTSTYTLLGSNGTCTNSALATLSVDPAFIISLSASKAPLCAGESVSITATGANNYTYFPGFVTVNPAVFSPTFNTTYTVTGNNGICSRTKAITINVTPAFTVSVGFADTLVCMSQSLTLNPSGATNYTTNPGGIAGNNVIITPVANTSYTITGEKNQCISNSVFNILVMDCNLVGVRENNLQEEILFFPNPASASLFVKAPVNSDVVLYNSAGQKVFVGAVMASEGMHIDTKNFAGGIYYAHVQQGAELRTFKIVLR